MQKQQETIRAFHEAERKKKYDEKWRIFLERLAANGGIVTLTLKQCGITGAQLRKRRAMEPDFEAAFQDSHERGIDKLEDVAKTRAMIGIPRPIFYKGRRIDSVNEVSDDLLKFILRGARPEKYGHKLDISGKIDLTGIELSSISMSDLEVIAAGRATQEFLNRLRAQQPALALAQSVAPASEHVPVTEPAAGVAGAAPEPEGSG